MSDSFDKLLGEEPEAAAPEVESTPLRENPEENADFMRARFLLQGVPPLPSTLLHNLKMKSVDLGKERDLIAITGTSISSPNNLTKNIFLRSRKGACAALPLLPPITMKWLDVHM